MSNIEKTKQLFEIFGNFLSGKTQEPDLNKDLMTLAQYIHSETKGAIWNEITKPNFKKFVMKCPALQKTGVVKPLGSGTEGAAFLLGDGSVLKILYKKNADITKYRRLSIQNKAKSGVAKVKVYNTGAIEGVSYVHMEKLITMDEWRESKPQLADVAEQTADAMWHQKMPYPSTDQNFKHFKPKVLKKIKSEKLSGAQDKVVNDVLVTAIKTSLSSKVLPDLHGENLGLVKRDGKMKFVFFDD